MEEGEQFLAGGHSTSRFRAPGRHYFAHERSMTAQIRQDR